MALSQNYSRIVYYNLIDEILILVFNSLRTHPVPIPIKEPLYFKK